jgi:hypothetical protein
MIAWYSIILLFLHSRARCRHAPSPLGSPGQKSAAHAGTSTYKTFVRTWIHKHVQESLCFTSSPFPWLDDLEAPRPIELMYDLMWTLRCVV